MFDKEFEIYVDRGKRNGNFKIIYLLHKFGKMLLRQISSL